MATNAELLTLVEAAIEKRLRGDAYEAYTEGGDRFQGASLEELFLIRDNLKAKVAAESSGTFSLAEPFDS